MIAMEMALKIIAIFEYGVLVLLLFLSVWSIAIMIEARRRLARESALADLEELRTKISGASPAPSQQLQVQEQLQDWIRAHPGVHAAALATAMRKSATAAATVDREVRSFLSHERLRLEKGLPVLATLGANAPFIGLFGTVLGIIRAFAALGESSGAATSVMAGISQALVATAAGLFVAIPAVVAFNAFSTQVRILISQCESLKDLYVASQGAKERG